MGKEKVICRMIDGKIYKLEAPKQPEQNSVAMVKANMKTFIKLIKEDDEIYTLALEVIKTMEEKE